MNLYAIVFAVIALAVMVIWLAVFISGATEAMSEVNSALMAVVGGCATMSGKAIRAQA